MVALLIAAALLIAQAIVFFLIHKDIQKDIRKGGFWRKEDNETDLQ